MRYRIFLVTLGTLSMVQNFSLANLPEFEGQGEATIELHDVVQARKQALLLAQQDSIIKAVASLLGTYQQIKAAEKLDKYIYNQSQRYIRTYRILEENQQQEMFIMRIMAMVDTKRLQQDIQTQQINASVKLTSPPSYSKIRIGWWTRPSWSFDTKGFPASLESSLENIGAIMVRLEGNTIEEALTSARENNLHLIMQISLTTKKIEGVRGIDFLAEEASARLKVIAIPTGQIVAEQKLSAISSAITQITAKRKVVENVLTLATPFIVSEIQKRVPQRKESKAKVIKITNIATYQQFEIINKALQENIPNIDACLLSHVSEGDIRYEVQTSLTDQELSSSLVTQRFESVILKQKSVDSGTIWFEVVAPKEMSAGEY